MPSFTRADCARRRTQPTGRTHTHTGRERRGPPAVFTETIAMLIAQISDLHIQHGGKDSLLIQAEQHLATCVDALNRLDPAPDVVVITGDLTEHGRKDEYQALKSLLEPLHAPFLLI